jgi:hypothetical protein
MKNREVKRIISLLLTFSLVLGMVNSGSLVSYADSERRAEEEEFAIIKDEDFIPKEYCIMKRNSTGYRSMNSWCSRCKNEIQSNL